MAATDVGWILSPPRSDKALALKIYLTTQHIPQLQSEEDSHQWIANSYDWQGYSSSRTWEVLRPRFSTKEWTESVWFSGEIPRHAFNFWLTTLNSLPTKVRLASWGLNVQTTCCFCNTSLEDRDHLFLSCTYTAVIWNLIFARLEPRRRLFLSWDELLSWTRRSSPSAPSHLRKLVTQSTIYNIWRQRNSAVHNNRYASTQITFKSIDRDVRNTITARTHRRHFCFLMQLWIR